MEMEEDHGENEGSALEPTALGAGIGLTFGTAFGAVFDNVAMGVAIGIVFGAAIAALAPTFIKLLEQEERDRSED
jgi:uncharacterized membrane protein